MWWLIAFVLSFLWQYLDFAFGCALWCCAAFTLALWWQCIGAFLTCALLDDVSTSWLALPCSGIALTMRSPCSGSASSSPLPSCGGVLTLRLHLALFCAQRTNALGLAAMAVTALSAGSMLVVPSARAGAAPMTSNTPLFYAYCINA